MFMKSSQIDNLKLGIERTDLGDLFKTLSFLGKNYKIRLQKIFLTSILFCRYFPLEFLMSLEAEKWPKQHDFDQS